MLYKAFVQFSTMTTSMITQKTDMGPNKNYMSKAAIRGIILEIQQEHILKRNRREVEICEAEEQLPKIAANNCMGNAIGAMATPERAACTTIAKARAGAPVVANSSNVRKDNRVTKLLRARTIQGKQAVNTSLVIEVPKTHSNLTIEMRRNVEGTMNANNTFINVPLIEMRHIFNTMVCQEKRIGIANSFNTRRADKFPIEKTMNHLI